MFSAADAAALADLDRQSADAVREGAINLEIAELERLAGRKLPEVRAVLSTPARSATGLAPTIAEGRSWGVLDIPHHLSADLDHWVDLQTRSTAEDVTILLSPLPTIPAGHGDGAVRAIRCPS